jgi:hypothetical protein
MNSLTIKCSCGDTFTLATSKNTGAWDDFRAWNASLALFMSQHDAHGGVTMEREER